MIYSPFLAVLLAPTIKFIGKHNIDYKNVNPKENISDLCLL